MEKKEGTHACFLLGSPLINCNTINKESNSQHSKKDRPSLETISSVTGRLRYKTALPRKESRGKTERKRRAKALWSASCTCSTWWAKCYVVDWNRVMPEKVKDTEKDEGQQNVRSETLQPAKTV